MRRTFLAVFGIVLTASRTSMVCALVALGVVIFSQPRARALRAAAALTAVLALAAVIGASAVPAGTWTRLMGTATEDTRASANAVKGVADELGNVAGRIRAQVDVFFDRLSA